MNVAVGARLRRAVPWVGAALGTLALVGGAAVPAPAAERSWVQVSPPGKEGANPGVAFGLTRSSPDGTALAFVSPGAFAGASGAPSLNWYVARRDGAERWSTRSITPAHAGGVYAGLMSPRVLALSDGMDRAVLRTFQALAPGTTGDEQNLVRLATGDGAQTAVTPVPVEFPNAVWAWPWLAGATADLGTVAFESPRALTGDAPQPLLTTPYVWSQAQGARLVAVLPDGTPAPDGGSIGQGASGFAASGPGRYTDRALSADGSRVVFTTPANPYGLASGHLYQWVDGSATLDVSAPQPGVSDPNGPQPATFWTAARDGGIVWFTSPEKLTADATTGPASAGNDLYRFDAATGALTDASADPAGPGASDGARVQGVLGASDDGEIVYFAALGVLAPGAVDGSPNVYVRDGSGTRLVATGAEASDWAQAPDLTSAIAKTARVTPDGRRLLFTSKERLATGDNAGHAAFYRYDLATATLTCVSCPPGGSAATAGATVDAGAFLSGQEAVLEAYQPRLLSDDGRRVAFETTAPLDPRDRNGALDVYLWEDGAVRLLSAGRGTDPAYLLDASASGDDLFFATSVPLAASDGDRLYDVYDATVRPLPPDGPPPPPAECEGDACQGPPTQPPSIPVLATVAFDGPGNVVPAAVPRPRGSVTVTPLRRAIRTTRFALRVRTPAGGRLTVTGAGVRAVRRRLVHGGAHRVAVALSRAGRRRLRARGRLALRLRVGYAATGRPPSAATVSVTVRTRRGAAR